MSTPVVKERIVLKYVNPKFGFEDKMYVGWNHLITDYIHTYEINLMTFGSVEGAQEEQALIGEPTEIKFLRYTIEEVNEITIFSNR